MGDCTSKPSASVEPNPYAPREASLPNDDSTPSHPGKSSVRSSPAVKASPFFPFYTPSPAKHRRNKSREGGGESTPLRQLARAFHPKSKEPREQVANTEALSDIANTSMPSVKSQSAHMVFPAGFSHALVKLL